MASDLLALATQTTCDATRSGTATLSAHLRVLLADCEGGRVRLLEIPGVDLQACGGTHVRNTREVGPVVVARIRSEGKRNKRVTLVFAGDPA